MGKYAWDHGLDYRETRTKLRGMVEAAREANQMTTLYYSSILLTQLINASRVSEAQDAIMGYGREGGRSQKVRVRKKRFRCLPCKHAKGTHLYSGENKRRESCKVYGCLCKLYEPDTSDIELRDMIIPREIIERDKEAIMACSGYSYVATRCFAIRKAGFNSHSLRYAAISEMADRTPLQVIAKITHHKSLDFIVDYTQQKRAMKVLKEIAAE